MNQKETNSNSTTNERASKLPGESLDTEKLPNDSNPEEIDNLPIESIGSYARLEESMTDETADDTGSPTAQNE